MIHNNSIFVDIQICIIFNWSQTHWNFMNRLELSQQSINPNQQFQSNQNSSNPQITAKKSRQRQISQSSKQNESKHMNSIKPYVKDRKISKRQSQKFLPTTSPYIQQSTNPNTNIFDSSSKSRNKKSEGKRLPEESGSKNIGDLYTELITIKSQYRTLKNSYNGLIKQNHDLTERGEKEAAHVLFMKKELENVKKQQEKNKNNLKFLEQQMERMKKQCVRMIEAEKFKNKKLEETLQQKQLMIAYLRSQLAVLNGETNTSTAFFFQHTAPTYLKPASTSIINSLTEQLISKSEIAIADAKNSNNINNNSINISNMNLPLAHPIPNTENKSYKTSVSKNLINNSIISSIHNNSGISQIIDLPKQMIKKKNQNQSIDLETYKNLNNNCSGKFGENIQEHSKAVAVKRQYIFSNQDDSLSFSYEKSKESIKDQQYQSVQSSEPTLLTFTKKDVYVIQDEQNKNKAVFYKEQNLERERNYSAYERNNIESVQRARNQHTQSSQGFSSSSYLNSKQSQNENENTQNQQQRSNFTGEQQILTFQNRYKPIQQRDQLIKMLNVNKERKRKQQNKDKQSKHKINKFKEKNLQISSKDSQQKKIASKGKLLTKRLEIQIQQSNYFQGKQSSAETKKRLVAQNQYSSKTGRKKLSRKRKSEDGSSFPKKIA